LKLEIRNINSLLYADNTILIGTSEGELQQLLDKVVKASKLTNSKPTCNLRIGQEEIEEKK